MQAVSVRANERISIYVLLDPSGETRYVGQTSCPSKRMRAHVGAQATPAVAGWIAELSASGYEPTMVVVAMAVSRAGAAEAEAAILEQERRRSSRILNRAAPTPARTGPITRHRISVLIHAPNSPDLNGIGLAELEAALKAGGDVRNTAAMLGMPERTLHRWVERAGATKPKPLGTVTVTDPEIRAAIRKEKSVSAAARALGVSHSTVQRRVAALGIEATDGRTLRPVRPKRKPA